MEGTREIISYKVARVSFLTVNLHAISVTLVHNSTNSDFLVLTNGVFLFIYFLVKVLLRKIKSRISHLILDWCFCYVLRSEFILTEISLDGSRLPYHLSGFLLKQKSCRNTIFPSSLSTVLTWRAPGLRFGPLLFSNYKKQDSFFLPF